MGGSCSSAGDGDPALGAVLATGSIAGVFRHFPQFNERKCGVVVDLLQPFSGIIRSCFR
jgi:hypothetical protein